MNEDPISDATVLVTAGGMAQANPVTTTGKTASRPAGIGGIKPYAVRYQTDDHDDDDMVTKSKETRNGEAQDASCCIIDHTEPYAVRYGEDDDFPTERNTSESAQTQDASSTNVNIEPYSVRYGEDGDFPTERNTSESAQTQDASSTNVNIEPYAVRYGEDDGVPTERNTTESEHKQDVSSANVSIAPYAVRCGEDYGVPTERNTTESEHKQDVSSANGNIEPYAVRCGEEDDVPTERNTTESAQTQDASFANVNIEPYAVRYGEDDVVPAERNTTESASSVRDDRNQAPMPNGPQQDICEDRYQHNSTANGSLGEATPTLSSSPRTSQAPNGEDEKPEKIVFGGLGTEPGKFQQACRVAVSDDNEIFVPDFYNRRIQVHNMSGVYLRLFPTVVPGKKVKMQPNGVAIDGEGHLWVAGVREEEVHVVQYRRHGQPLSKFDVTGVLVYPEIAVDVDNHKIIVTNKNEILVFQPNGSLHLRFRETQRSLISSVTTDSKGNILVTVIPNSIQVYNRHGVRLFTAGTCRRGQFPCHSRGICLDTLGRIVVANGLPGRVDMYTSRGKFVRTLVNIEDPWGIAIGRDGQLLVTSKQEGTVTIFPRQVVYNTGN
ncbi:uncharacterized protein LOC118407084 [Branchiostoma floridae]|uniref:Uncharacterized protein LOC118407084 n=1 Tax=Branchiostoma floridae TaxID=7739 RepID=A0A9J7HS00_BRAFL|nr:uncharacterized protein LOC118407084 [Branchiostoma floridae]